MARRVAGVARLDEPLPASVVTLGTFDGVHLGHQHLVARAREAAAGLGVPVVAYTFDPHPAQVLAPHAAPRLLCSTDERVRLLGEQGIEVVLVEPFDAAFAAIDADTWVRDYLVGALHPRHVVVGFNFTYGQGRGGDTDHLRRSGERFGFEVEVVEAVQQASDVVSSTRIRGLLQEGDLAMANRLLGRPYSLIGEVVEGDRRGRTIGFPTANQRPDAQLFPAHGVYATRATLDDGSGHDAVTNIGRRPTFGGDAPVAETHLLDFDGDLYGRVLRVELIERLRAEQRFDGVDALIAQIRADADRARERLATLRDAP